MPHGPDTDTEALFEKAQELVAGGKIAEAEDVCEQVLTASPDHARANHMRGALLLARNSADSALPFLQRSVDLGNDHHMLPFHMGLAQTATGNNDEAVRCFEQAVEKNPTLPDAAYNLGLSLLSANRAEESLNAFSRASELAPENASAAGAWGSALMTLNRVEEAITQFDRALSLDPDSVVVLNNKAYALGKLGDTATALPLLWKAYEIDTSNEGSVQNLTDCLRRHLDNDEAVAGMRRLAQDHESNALVRGVLSFCLERAGQLEEAETVARETLSLLPTSYFACLTLARCHRRAGRLEDARDQFTAILSHGVSDVERSVVLKERAQVLDRLDDFGAAFSEFQDANTLVASLPLEERKRSTIFESIRNTQAWLDRQSSPLAPPTTVVPQDTQSDPVFFVGFPRSGTTLLETILTAHPRIISADERAWIRMTMEQTGFMQPESWAAMSDTDVQTARNTYLGFARRVHGDELTSHRLLDKMPFNIVHLGFINRVFPKAKILVALRDPRDCVLSAFMQNFARVSELRPFLKLDTGAQYYADVMNVYLGYRNILPMNCLEYRYEDLANNPRATLVRILDHLDEPWDDAVLNHTEAQHGSRAINTPSARDVTEQVYARASQRWQNYADKLEPIIPILKPYLEAFGYE